MTKIVKVSGGAQASSQYGMSRWYEVKVSHLASTGLKVFNNPVVEEKILEALNHYTEQTILRSNNTSGKVTLGFKSSKASFKIFYNDHDLYACNVVALVNRQLYCKMVDAWLKPSIAGGKFNEKTFAKCVAENRLY